VKTDDEIVRELARLWRVEADSLVETGEKLKLVDECGGDRLKGIAWGMRKCAWELVEEMVKKGVKE
jgi:hypothetical protein